MKTIIRQLNLCLVGRKHYFLGFLKLQHPPGLRAWDHPTVASVQTVACSLRLASTSTVNREFSSSSARQFTYDCRQREMLLDSWRSLSAGFLPMFTQGLKAILYAIEFLNPSFFLVDHLKRSEVWIGVVKQF